MPIVNLANHFIETNGNPIDPDKKNSIKTKKIIKKRRSKAL